MPSTPQNTNVKTYIRMTQAARYRVTGRLSDARIAELVGLTPGGFAQMTARPEYKEIEEALLEGRISKIDEQIAGDDEALRDTMKVAVPLALRALVEGVQQRRDLRTMLAAAKEILDRSPEGGFRSTRASAEQAGGSEGPTLPADIIANLSIQGNKVVMEMKASPAATPHVTATVELPPSEGTA